MISVVEIRKQRYGEITQLTPRSQLVNENPGFKPRKTNPKVQDFVLTVHFLPGPPAPETTISKTETLKTLVDETEQN